MNSIIRSPVLYAEDEADDVFFMQRAWKEAGVQHPLQTVSTGKDVIAYLSGQGRFANRADFPVPILLLLDLNMPHTSGFEVLEWWGRQPALVSLPIVVFSSSNRGSDIERAASLRARGFLVKPGKPHELVQMVKALNEYWLVHDHFGKRIEAGLEVEI